MPASSPDARAGVPLEVADRLAQASRALIGWYRREARDLPWRQTDDPYRILVSEVMLQQTRVETVRERYVEFLQRFPDLPSLARADEEEVLAAWSGLGYYRRARNLHRLARTVVAEHDGRLPGDRAALRALPGIGDYTSAAVASIAFGEPALTVDGNVARVLYRLLGLAADPRLAAVRRPLEEAMAGPLRSHSPGALNQALMELGAVVCLPRAPRCDRCPCATWCRALELGAPERLPLTRATAVHEVEEAAAVIVRDGRYLLMRDQRLGILERMWEFPTLDSRLREPATVREEAPGEAPLAAELSVHLAGLGLHVAAPRLLGTVRHAITARRILCHVYRVRLERVHDPLTETDAAPPEAAWFAPAEAAQIPIAASTRRILDLLAGARSISPRAR